ncbi:MAG: hypothetical protein ACI9JN_000140 [Bacteroidia bacterium]
MKESFLHYIWQTAQFDHTDLTTTSGAHLTILKKGSPHQDGGPDFINALIKLDSETWAGQVEIHIQSSDWFKHNHHLDSAYDNTVLHVVYEYDADVRRSNGTIIPCLILKPRIGEELLLGYERLTNNSDKIPCHNMLPHMANETAIFTIEAKAIDRLKDKSVVILNKLERCQNDWQEVLYQMIAIALGMRVNKVPFELLAKQLPLKLISKYRNNLETMEALVFGSAGFLHKHHVDAYGKSLFLEYIFLSTKHQITPIPVETWKFLRLRPANFPTIRLAQLATLLHQKEGLFSRVKDELQYDNLLALFRIEPSAYWRTHYRFDQVSANKSKQVGKNLIHNILINAVVPILYCYGLKQNNLMLQDQCLELLESIPAEQNAITLYYQTRGLTITNALQSQGVLQLHNKLCIFKDCLNCQIGHHILKRT